MTKNRVKYGQRVFSRFEARAATNACGRALLLLIVTFSLSGCLYQAIDMAVVKTSSPSYYTEKTGSSYGLESRLLSVDKSSGLISVSFKVVETTSYRKVKSSYQGYGYRSNTTDSNWDEGVVIKLSASDFSVKTTAKKKCEFEQVSSKISGVSDEVVSILVNDVDWQRDYLTFTLTHIKSKQIATYCINCEKSCL